MPSATRSNGAFAGMISANNHTVASSPSSSGRRRTVENTTSQNIATASVTRKIGRKYSSPMKKQANAWSG